MKDFLEGEQCYMYGHRQTYIQMPHRCIDFTVQYIHCTNILLFVLLRFGYVEFSSEKEAKKALKLNGRELFGRKIRVDNANSSQSPGNRGRGGTPRGTPRGGGGRGGEGVVDQEFVCSASAVYICTYVISRVHNIHIEESILSYTPVEEHIVKF